MKLIPTPGQVIVRLGAPDTTTPSGLIIQTKADKCTAVLVDANWPKDHPAKNHPFEVGSRVVYRRGAGQGYDDGLLILSVDDILAVETEDA